MKQTATSSKVISRMKQVRYTLTKKRINENENAPFCWASESLGGQQVDMDELLA
jgi:hypothetical protein